jgi:hypothetical protein
VLREVIHIAQISFAPAVHPTAIRINQEYEYMSNNFERWKELASLTSKERDPAKLTELASEMNLVLTQKTPYVDPPLREPLK